MEAWWINQIITRLINVVPWLLGVGGAVAVITWSPLGRALTGHFRERRRDSALTEEMLAELSAIRQTLGEVVERLDATEQRLARGGISLPRLEQERPSDLPSGRVLTPG